MKPTIHFKPHIASTEPYVGGSTRERNATKKIYKLSSNENLLGPSPKALSAILKNLDSLHEYDFQDDSILCDALTAFFHHEATPRQFITANSCMELLDLICRAFLEPGDQVILSTPTFLAYRNFAAVSGGTTIDVPLKGRDFSIDIDNMVRAVDAKTKIIFISSPNNPTGSIVTSDAMQQLLEQLPPHVVVVYDEVYHHYVEHPKYARAWDFIRKGFPVIGLHSFSKAYGLAGMRVGYAFSTPDMAGYLRRLRRPFMLNTLAVVGAMAALTDDRYIRQSVQLVEKEKAWMYTQLKNMGVTFYPSHANFILLKPPYAATHFAADILDAGIMVRTTEPFGAPDMIRVTIGTRPANAAFINVLKILL